MKTLPIANCQLPIDGGRGAVSRHRDGLRGLDLVERDAENGNGWLLPSPLAGTMQLKWGAHASGAPFAAGRRKLHPTNFELPEGPSRWVNEADGGTPVGSTRDARAPQIPRHGGRVGAACCGAGGTSGARAFSMVELLVTMTLLSLIVLALMAVFSSTQRAFRASVTQTDVLEGSRAAIDLIASDLRTMTPANGPSNYFYGGFRYSGPVNFAVLDNSYAGSSFDGAALRYQPLAQNLPGSSVPRLNVLNYFFFLGRYNQKWTGVGYVVDATNSQPLYPLYRFYAETNISISPYTLFTAFLDSVNESRWTNMSHVLDGVVHLTVRPYDAHGYRMTNLMQFYAGQTNYYTNVLFFPPIRDESGCYFYSNVVPASVELQIGVLEDRTLQRVQSLGNGVGTGLNVAQTNYLFDQAGHVHVFRQRINIPNVDPSAYQ